MINRVTLAAAGAVVAVLLIEWIAGASAGAALLPALTFWAAVCQGLVALVAATLLSNATWSPPIHARLLRALPLLLMFPAVFLIWSGRISLYPWTGHPTRWLAPGFFITRNVVLLLAVFAAAYVFARTLERRSRRVGICAVVYIFVFVTTESVMAFDWFMSLEAPWISTLFGGYFFIESFYVGVAIALLAAAWAPNDDPEKFLGIQVDLAKLLLGFALFWAGQLFAQYLTIWYGNIPEEVSYLYERAAVSPYREMSVAVLLLMFILPFGLLIPKAVKRSRAWVTGAAVCVIVGYIIERILFVQPVRPVNGLIMVLELVILGIPVILALFGPIQSDERRVAA
jgi:hypothetical protein